MPTILQHRRGTTSQNNSFTGALGEISVDTDLDTLRVHDGTTAGGFQITQNAATQTLTNKTLTTPVITEIDSGSTITLDATTDIVLDAGGADIILKDDGTTFGGLTNTSANLIIKSGTTTMLTGSGANATFAGNLTVSGDLDVTGDFDMSDANLTNVGSISLDSITGDADANTSITFSGSDVITIATGGSTAATFNASQVLTLSGNMVIPDAGTIGSASDTNAISISSGGVVAVTATTANTSASNGALTVAGGLGVAADASVGDDLRLISDAAVLSFGADSDVTLTHVADTGILLNSTMAIQFNDASQFINAPSATVLDINATDEIELNATLVDVNANLDVSGTIVSGGTLTATTSIGIGSAVLTEAELELLDGITAGTAAASKVLVLDSDKDIGTIRNLTIDGVFTDGNYTFDTSGNVSGLGTVASGAITSSGIIKTDNTTAATSTTDGSLQTDGGLSVAADAVIGDDLILLSDSAILSFGADSEIALTHVHNTGLLLTDSGGSPTLQLTDAGESVSSDGSKLILTSNSVAFSLPTADGNAGQFLKTNGSAVLSFDTVSSAADDISAGDAAVTITTSSGNITIDAAANDSDLIIKGTDNNADITMATFDGSDAGTLILNHDLELGTDGSIVKFGADNEIALTHVADIGLLLTDSGGGPTLQLTDANESISSDGSNLILTSGGTAFTIPASDGNANQVLATDGNGVLSFATSSANTPSSADGQALGSASLEWSDLFLADGGTVTFGNDQDVILTHVADVGLTLSHVATADNKPIVLQLKSEEDDIAANEIIASLEFAAGDSDGTDGATVAAGIHAIAEGTFSASANATKLVFTTGVSETAAASATAKMTLSSVGLLTVADDIMIKDGGTIGVASTNDAITISSAGIVTFKDDILIKDGGTIGAASATTAITIASTGIVTLVDDLILKDAATIGVASSTSAITIASTGIVSFVDDIIIKDAGTIGSASAATAITIASSGIVTLVDDLILKDAATIGVTSSTSAISIASTGIVTFVDDILIKDAGTIGSASDPDAIAIGSDGDVTLTQDLELQHDGAILSFGADDEVSLTHVHDAGLLLNSTNKIQFNDASQFIHAPSNAILDIAATDEIELTATLIEVVGNATVSGTLGVTGIATFTDDIIIGDGKTIGSASATTAITIASTGIVTLVDDLILKDAATIGVASSTSAITIASSGIVSFVDDITIKNGGTIGTASDADSITIAAAGGCTFSQTIVASGGLTGTASAAVYGDLAEKYIGDQTYSPGTVMQVGGTEEITAASASSAYVAGVISTLPGFLMNSELENGQELAFVGRVPTRVTGSITKGQPVFADNGGVASNTANGPLVGLALESSSNSDEKLIECMLKV